MKRSVITAALLIALANGSAAETQWPRFQGAYLQLTTGELVEIPNLKNHPLRDHRSFEREVLDALPRVNAWEIEAVIFSNQDKLTKDGRLDITMTALVDQRDDPGNYCTRECDGELVVSNWGFPLQYFHIEYGQGSAGHVPNQVALYPRDAEIPFVLPRTGRTGGNVGQDIEFEAALFEGACCNAYWGYIPIFEADFE